MSPGNCNVLWTEFTRMGQEDIASSFWGKNEKKKEKKRTLASKCVLRLCPISIYLLVLVTFVVSPNPWWESLVFPWGAGPTRSEYVWGWRGCGFGYLLFGCFSASWGVVMSIHQVRSKRLHPCGQIFPLWTVSGFMELIKNYSRRHGCQEGTPDIHTLPHAANEVPGSFCLYAAKFRRSWFRLIRMMQGQFYWAEEGPWFSRAKLVLQKQGASGQHHDSVRRGTWSFPQLL